MTEESRMLEASRQLCGVVVGDQPVDPWMLSIDTSAEGRASEIQVVLGALLLVRELQEASVGVTIDGLENFVRDDIRTSPSVSMEAYLDIVRGAASPPGISFVLKRWRRRNEPPRWLWKSVDGVSLSPTGEVLRLEGVCVPAPSKAYQS